METFSSPGYSPHSLVYFIHIYMPRFGHSTIFSQLFSRDVDVQKEYAYGVFYSAIAIVSIFVIWALIIFGVKLTRCNFREAVGHRPHAESIKSKGYADSSTSSYSNISNTIRIVYIVSGVIMICSSTFFLVFAIDTVERTKTSIGDSIMGLHDVVDNADGVLRSFDNLSKLYENISDTAGDLGSFCPNADLNPGLGLSFNVIKFRAALEYELLRFYNYGYHIRYGNSVINATMKGIDTIDSIMKNSFILNLILAISTILLNIVTAALVSAVMLAWRGRLSKFSQDVLSNFICPIQFLLVFSALILAISTSILVILNADACSGGERPGNPGSTIMNIMHERLIPKESAVYSYIKYYVEECQFDNSYDTLENFQASSQQSLLILWEFLSAIDVFGTVIVSNACGAEIITAVTAAQDITSTLNDAVIKAGILQESLSCGQINPMYVQAVHNSFCMVTPNRLLWAILMLFLIIFFSMIMITLSYAWVLKTENPKKVPQIIMSPTSELDDYIHYMSQHKHEWESCSEVSESYIHSNSTFRIVGDSDCETLADIVSIEKIYPGEFSDENMDMYDIDCDRNDSNLSIYQVYSNLGRIGDLSLAFGLEEGEELPFHKSNCKTQPSGKWDNFPKKFDFNCV